MKSVRFDRLLASTALGLVLMLSSYPGMAQQSEKQIESAVPMPDTSLPPPLTAKDVEGAPSQAAPAKSEPTAAASAPAATPTPAATTSAAADSAVSDRLREMVSGKQFDRLVSRKADRAGIEQFYSARNFAPL